jgi:hypothetical protein
MAGNVTTAACGGGLEQIRNLRGPAVSMKLTGATEDPRVDTGSRRWAGRQKIEHEAR